MLHHPCILEDPQTTGDKIRIGPQVGGNPTSPLHSRGFPNKGGQNQNWPTSGRKCYITLAFSVIPKQERTKSELAHEWAGNATSPLHSRGSPNNEGQNQNWPTSSGNATSALHSRGFPNKRGQNQNWPTSGRKCYITPAFSGIPKQRGTKSELAHKWAEMLHYPYVLGDPQHRRRKSELAHKWAEMLHHPCILGDSQKKWDKIRIGPQLGGNATSPLHSRRFPNNGGQNQN